MEKTYILNNQEVNCYGETIPPKKTNKAISILLGLGIVGLLSTGTYMALETIPKILVPEPQIIATVTNPEKTTKKYEVTLPNGYYMTLSKEELLEYIKTNEHICVNGVYYSTSEESLMAIETQVTHKESIKLQEATVYVVEKKPIPSPEKDGEYIVVTETKEEKIPIVPNGYILEDGRGIRYETTKTTYILTTEEYIKYLEEKIASKGQPSRYSAELVEAKPISELYNLLGVEQPKTNKLTK